MKYKVLAIALSFLVVSGSQAFDMKDLQKTVDRSHKCKDGDQSCKNREHLKAAARVAAVAVAVKLIADMVVEYRSQKVTEEAQVVAEYKNLHKTLPPEPVATEYVTNTLPGKVVEPGKQVSIKSNIVVVPGSQQKTALIEERLSIYDNEDNTKELKNLTKAVNEKNKTGGRYQNEFSFTLPEGLPQGVYPIRNELLLNGKVVETTKNDIQLVLQVNSVGEYQLLAMN